MVKLRDAGYCNLKLFLIYCVIYGHLIENAIYDSAQLLTQYRIIYTFHMPLFIFLSGLFLNSVDACIRQIKRFLPMYIFCQTLCVAIALLCGKAIRGFVPRWILWYLLSYCLWSCLGCLWFWLKNDKIKWFVLVISVLLGGLAGYLPWLNRTWSGSRTIVFFPYFFAGLICNPNTQWQKYRYAGIIAFVIASSGMLLFGNQIPVSFLYHAEPFGTLENGFALRILCYCIGGLLGFFLLTIMPIKRFPFTKAGADTMPAYLIHAPVVLFFRKLHLSWTFHAVLAIVILFVIYKFLQWSSTLYGIVSSERRDRSVGISRDI